MPKKHYSEELKTKVMKLYLQEGRTKKSLTEEFGLGQGTLTYWLQQYREGCKTNLITQEELAQNEEIRRLKKQLEASQKEVNFLKKAAAFFAREID
jgi:transposase